MAEIAGAGKQFFASIPVAKTGIEAAARPSRITTEVRMDEQRKLILDQFTRQAVPFSEMHARDDAEIHDS